MSPLRAEPQGAGALTSNYAAGMHFSGLPFMHAYHVIFVHRKQN
jgi:hypothetical protein